jgi:hypothetical protein
VVRVQWAVFVQVRYMLAHHLPGDLYPLPGSELAEGTGSFAALMGFLLVMDEWFSTISMAL